jgi:hypothetical protein
MTWGVYVYSGAGSHRRFPNSVRGYVRHLGVARTVYTR